MRVKSLLFIVYLWLISFFIKAQDKPNFVWLVSEDNSKHFLKLFDEHGAETPNIEKMAGSGIVFDHAFSNAPVCSVARTTLITGCYGPRIGTQFHRKSTVVPMPEGLKMFPAYLRDAGYYTTNKSKKDYNAIEGKGVWDKSSKKATWRNRQPDQPFFHCQSFGASHEGSLHFSKETMDTLKTKTNPDSVFIPPIHPNTETFKYTYARYHDRIKIIDKQVGDVIKMLEEDNLLENTFIFYFGDHGGVLPGSKGYVYETGLHVPLVVRIPEKWKHLVNIEKGTRVDGFVSFIDFGPTLLHLAGIDVPEQMDGKPFLGPKITLEEVNKRDETFGYADRFDEKWDLVRTLRKGKFKYMRSYQPFNFDGLQNNYRYRMLAYQEWRELHNEGKLTDAQSIFFKPRAPEALYNIEDDPYETNNLANDPEYKDLLEELRNKLTKQVKSMPDLSFYPESELAKEAFKNPVGFGQDNKTDIEELIDIANLSLLDLKDAKGKITEALNSDDPYKRYWALIVCSSLNEADKGLVDAAKLIAKNDTVNLVRVRAAEYLTLIGEDDPRPVIMDVLKNANSGLEAGFILNTVVLLQDGKTAYDFNITKELFTEEQLKDTELQRRLLYLAN